MNLTGKKIKIWAVVLIALAIFLVAGYLIYNNLILKINSEPVALDLTVKEEKELIDWEVINSEVFKGLKEWPIITTSTEIGAEIGRENPFLKF
ncbi:MAG TPA: hypothetical protein PKZ16_00245 [bacterium]|nr:hypothetical protein [bacterium]HPL95680.1 hypothetical protein [bacterium]